MIIVKIIGGLGNQMFQYALAFSLAKRTGSVVKLDTRDFQIYDLHKYSLDKLNIHLPVATEQECRSFQSWLPLHGPLSVLAKFIPPSSKRLVERGQNFDSRILNIRDNRYLDGYWQSEKYFRDQATSLREEFTVLESPPETSARLMNDMRATTSVSLHIRRGDYVTDKNANTVHGVLSLEYYKKSMELLHQKLGDPTFYVFSDDHAWVKDQFSALGRMVFVDHNGADKNYDDLRLMSSCQHHVIANSSFSWWGAWLNPSPEKIVIGPKAWFQTLEFDIHDRLPEGWLTV